MHIRKITPNVVENENTNVRNKWDFFVNLESGPSFFPTNLSMIYLTNSGYVILICIFFSADNYFRLIRLVQKFVLQKKPLVEK